MNRTEEIKRILSGAWGPLTVDQILERLPSDVQKYQLVDDLTNLAYVREVIEDFGPPRRYMLNKRRARA